MASKQQVLIRSLDRHFAKLIRKRDQRKPCIDLCGRVGAHQAGHFRDRRHMATRFHPQNVNGQNTYCNCWNNDTYQHAMGIDKRWGQGTAKKLYRLSKTIKQWTVPELQALVKAAKTSMEEYENVYFSL